MPLSLVTADDDDEKGRINWLGKKTTLKHQLSLAHVLYRMHLHKWKSICIHKVIINEEPKRLRDTNVVTKYIQNLRINFHSRINNFFEQIYILLGKLFRQLILLHFSSTGSCSWR